jgi:hypothetical protein
MRSQVVIGILIIVGALVAHPARAAADEESSEEHKIESLIKSIETLADATFVRNGKEYDCKAAGQHVRRKWKAAKDQIATARQFISAVASKSDRSGEAYRIRFKGGKEQMSEAFFTTKLDEIEGKRAGDKHGSA